MGPRSVSAGRQRVMIGGAAVLLFLLGLSLVGRQDGSLSGSGATDIHRPGSFLFPKWNNKDETISTKTLLETPFLRVEDHTVYNPDAKGSKKDGTGIIHHWMWTDVPDQVNILVSVDKYADEAVFNNEAANDLAEKAEADHRKLSRRDLRDEKVEGLEEVKATNDPHGNHAGREEVFRMFRQRKYGYEGTSLAVVGGMLANKRESPLVAAQREVEEELGYNYCEEWVQLGGGQAYRTDVNRGGGHVTCFLARFCRSDKTKPRRKKAALRAAADLEKQEIVDLSNEELHDALLRDRAEAYSFDQVKEVKWANTVALSLLHLARHPGDSHPINEGIGGDPHEKHDKHGHDDQVHAGAEE